MFKRVLFNEKVYTRTVKVDVEESRYTVSVTPTPDGYIISCPTLKFTFMTSNPRNVAYKMMERDINQIDSVRVEKIVGYIMDNWDAPTYYIVGIDGRLSADPEYYFDRWECIPAMNEQEALTKYRENYKDWIRPDEQKLVAVHGTAPEAVFVQQWIKENMK